VPVGSTIDGIEVYTTAASTDNAGCRLAVSLSWNNGSNYTSTQTRTLVSSSVTAASIGSATDTWGRTWAPNDFTNANFVIKLQDNDPGGNCDNDATTFVDFLRVTVYYTPPAPQPDLVVNKVNNVSGNVFNGSTFDWTFTITNVGQGSASFSNQDIFEDDLPTNANYSPTSNIPVTLAGGTAGSVDCDISNDTIDCDDNNGGTSVLIPAGGSFSFVVTLTPDGLGTLNNPRSGNGNICRVDPDSLVSEINEGNNNCSDSVTVSEVQSAPNPALTQACGLDIALVLDNSTSIDAGEMTQMKSAMTAFTTALDGTPTEFSVTRFASTGVVLQNFTADASVANAAINGILVGGGFTDWEDGFIDAASTLPNRSNPDLVIFASDGDPTASSAGADDSGQPNVHLTPAIIQANGIKNSGTRILVLGIGSPAVSRLQAISGPNVDTGSVFTSDVITSDFSELAGDLAEFAEQTCGGTITTTKLLDADGNLATTNDRTPAQGWGVRY
jgi:hypothetical protein